MFSGQFRDEAPWIEVELVGRTIELLIDTGFAGDIALPPPVAAELLGSPTGARLRKFADGRVAAVPVYECELESYHGPRLAEIVAVGDVGLVGTTFFEGCHLHIEVTDGGEVEIELI